MIPTIDDLAAGRTLAEIQGFTAEMGAAIASLAAQEAGSGDLDLARGILEGLVVTNPRDALAWAMLSQVERRRGEPLTALLCAEAAVRLAPGDRQARLVRVEAILAVPIDAGAGGADRWELARSELGGLISGQDDVARRAAALLRALRP